MSIVSTVAGAFLDRYRVYLYIAAAVAIAATVASATVYVMHLQSKSAAFDALTVEVDQLKSAMACGAGEGVLACHQRQQKEAAAARAAALAEQARVNAGEQNRLAAERDRLAADLARIDAAADADQDAGERIPAALGRYYDRERQRRGIK